MYNTILPRWRQIVWRVYFLPSICYKLLGGGMFSTRLSLSSSQRNRKPCSLITRQEQQWFYRGLWSCLDVSGELSNWVLDTCYLCVLLRLHPEIFLVCSVRSCTCHHRHRPDPMAVAEFNSSVVGLFFLKQLWLQWPAVVFAPFSLYQRLLCGELWYTRSDEDSPATERHLHQIGPTDRLQNQPQCLQGKTNQKFTSQKSKPISVPARHPCKALTSNTNIVYERINSGQPQRKTPHQFRKADRVNKMWKRSPFRA